MSNVTTAMEMIAVVLTAVVAILLITMLVRAAQLRKLGMAQDERDQPVAPSAREERFTRERDRAGSR